MYNFENLVVYDESKTNILIDFDLTKGELREDKRFVCHQEYQEEEMFDKDGNSNGFAILDKKDIYESIYVYHVWTEEEIEQRKHQERSNKITEEIRKKYSVSDELAILRQRDINVQEFEEYNEYIERIKSQI